MASASRNHFDMEAALHETVIHGHAASTYRAVADAFAENFRSRGDIGASVALVVESELVVDLWGGSKDGERANSWEADTVANIWSTTKGVTATCFAMLVDRGLIEYDRPVAHYWPEFAAAGKEGVTVAMLLSHQAGLCGFRDLATVEDYYDASKGADRLAAAKPFWHPGTQSGYHAITIGLLATELFRRVEGRSLKHFVSEELHDYEITIGLPEALQHRAATMIAPPEMASAALMTELSPPQIAALANPPLDPLIPNNPAWRAADIPSANGFATARGLAKLYGALAAGGSSLVGARAIDAATTVQIENVDAVLGVEARWACGFLRNVNGIYGLNAEAFGHSGWGGAFAFADPSRRLGFAYVMNRMGTDLIDDPRNVALIEALYNVASKDPSDVFKPPAVHR
jgi:CubicO group peptidase (beta-lactamase class C family)